MTGVGVEITEPESCPASTAAAAADDTLRESDLAALTSPLSNSNSSSSTMSTTLADGSVPGQVVEVELGGMYEAWLEVVVRVGLVVVRVEMSSLEVEEMVSSESAGGGRTLGVSRLSPPPPMDWGRAEPGLLG